jgi:hypothetical protein
MSDPDRGASEPSSRWPRRRRSVRHRHDPARWDPERTGEDLPSLAGTVALTATGVLALAALVWWVPTFALALIAGLLVWSVTVDATGNRVSTRVRGPVAVGVWALLRPAYVVGVVLWGLVEGLFELFA